MRLLYITDVCPWPATNGGLLRTARLIEQLARRNDLRVISFEAPIDGLSPPVRTEFFPLRHLMHAPRIPEAGWGQRWGVAKGVFHPLPHLFRQHQIAELRSTFRRLRRLADEYDVVWISWPYIAEVALEEWSGVRVVVDFVDIAHLAQGSQLKLMPSNLHKLFTSVDTLKLAWHERRVAQRAWRSVACKAEDARFLNQPRKVFVVPNGTDPRPHLDPAAVDTNPPRILFVGLMSYLPNADAAQWFVRQCLPHLSDMPLAVDLVGGTPPERVRALADGERVRVHGFVDDLEGFYRRAAVVIAPIRLGSGTKLKVLEALGFGKALVATSEAARGIGIRPGEEFVEANTPAEFASACRRLIQDAELRGRIGRAGRAYVEGRYTWDRIGEIAQRAVTP